MLGVGVGTLYRHYPSREALLAALTHRSFRMVLGAAQRAAAADKSAIECIRRFLDETIQHGAELVLPAHGGPVPVDQATLVLRAEATTRSTRSCAVAAMTAPSDPTSPLSTSSCLGR
jgi:AcrR family transcriptional regulator